MQRSPLDIAETPPPFEPGFSKTPSSRARRMQWIAVILGGAMAAGIILFVLGNWVIMPLVARGSIVRVPELYGLDVAVAKRTLLDSSLVFVNDSTDFLWDDDVPANHVVSQNPPPYAAVKSGRRVRVVISRGPQMYRVPDVRNISPIQAQLRLQQQLFEVGDVSYVLRTNEDRSEPLVTDQTPPPATMLPRGAKVDITISIVPEMPDLSRRSFKEAKHYINLLGLQVGSVTSEQSDDLLPRSVMKQSIPPGRRIQVGDTVDLVLSHL